ncbi:hypothetical protein [Desulfocurvus vexinensis]|nr:hypothetical protein [Desulfocurvus vexinensis]
MRRQTSYLLRHLRRARRGLAARGARQAGPAGSRPWSDHALG